MKAAKIVGHIALDILIIVLLTVLPVVTHFDIFHSGKVDAVSSASIELPDQPSGSFLVLMKTSLHEDSLNDWDDFFNDRDFAVIFEDIDCLVASKDESAKQLAERFRAQLPENQMKVRSEDPTLLVSKAEAGYIDVAIFSKEMADALALHMDELSGVRVFEVTGGE